MTLVVSVLLLLVSGGVLYFSVRTFGQARHAARELEAVALRYKAREKEIRQVRNQMIVTHRHAKRLLVESDQMRRKIEILLADPVVQKALSRGAETIR